MHGGGADLSVSEEKRWGGLKNCVAAPSHCLVLFLSTSLCDSNGRQFGRDDEWGLTRLYSAHQTPLAAGGSIHSCVAQLASKPLLQRRALVKSAPVSEKNRGMALKEADRYRQSMESQMIFCNKFWNSLIRRVYE
jgi:hypothetical protein